MLNIDLSDKLKETKMVCDIHHHRMMMARNYLTSLFPLDETTYSKLTDEQISYSDQLIYRFAKLQDTMGNKLFKYILEGLGEETQAIPFIDIIIRLEKLNLLDNHNNWILMRETRNLVSHEYPFNQSEIIDGLNELYKQAAHLSDIWIGFTDFIAKRFQI